MYYIRGVINFIPPASKSLNEAIGHCTVYSWRDTINKWEQFDDLSTTTTIIVRPNSVAVNCQLFVYTVNPNILS